MKHVIKDKIMTKDKIDLDKLGIEVIFDSTKTEEYKGAHSIGCKN